MNNVLHFGMSGNRLLKMPNNTPIIMKKQLAKILIYLMVAFYLMMGSMHFFSPAQYNTMVPDWVPWPSFLILASGVAEIVLAVLLLFEKTRAMAARLVIVMLVVFLVLVHVPETITYYQTQHPNLVMSIVRLPIQLVFIAWAWMFTESNPLIQPDKTVLRHEKTD